MEASTERERERERESRRLKVIIVKSVVADLWVYHEVLT